MKDYKCIKIICPPDVQELMLAAVDDDDFEVYEQTDEALLCYLPEEKLTDEKLKGIETLIHSFGWHYEISNIPYKNWNEAWEQNFEPIRVDDFVGVRAEFHKAFDNVRFDLVINPKMAFGTGHHETTYQMMEMMQTIDFKAKSVLDYGCGTGILGILAAKLSAAIIEGNDITEESIENTIENCSINKVDNFTVSLGKLDLYDGKVFDIILANINRNVLLESANALFQNMSHDGHLLTSGYMPEDQTLIEECYTEAGFRMESMTQKAYWLCHHWVKQ